VDIDGVVSVWDAGTGHELNRLRGHTDVIRGVAWSRDGTLVASAGNDGAIKLWSPHMTQAATILQTDAGEARGLDVSANGKALLVATQFGGVQIRDLATGAITRRLPTDVSADDAAYLVDGRRCAVIGRDGTLQLWDAAAGKLLKPLASGTASRALSEVARSVAADPLGRFVASAGDDENVYLWNVETGRQQQKLAGHSAAVNDVAFSPDGRYLASAGRDRNIKIWDVEQGREFMTLRGHAHAVMAVKFSPDGTRIASAGFDWTAKLWDASSGKLLETMSGHTQPVRDVAMSPDGSRLVTVSNDRTIRIWDTATGRELLTLPGHENWVRKVVFSPTGHLLVSASDDATVRLWDGSSKSGQ
jgi:WD40 repeat protein